MREIVEYEINGRTYLIGHWSVDKSLQTLVWLTKTFGEGFVTLFTSETGSEFLFGSNDSEEGSEEKSETSPEEDTAMIKEFVSNIVDKLDEETYVKYAKHIIDGVRFEGKKITFNTHFIQRMGELHMLMFKVLKVQYSDFLGGGQESDSSEV